MVLGKSNKSGNDHRKIVAFDLPKEEVGDDNALDLHDDDDEVDRYGNNKRGGNGKIRGRKKWDDRMAKTKNKKRHSCCAHNEINHYDKHESKRHHHDEDDDDDDGDHEGKDNRQ